MAGIAQEPVPSPPRGRLVRAILKDGSEPDPRFTLANERTFLAWIRTSLALLAGGLALEAFAADLFPDVIRLSATVALLSCASLLATLAGFRWLKIERALRWKRPLPLSLMAPLLACIGAFGSLSLLTVLILEAWKV